jgi:hypothetical protein
MKLINRKTRKAIDKSVQKALKRHGPALLAGLASGLASSLATLAKTEAPGEDGKSGKSNLAVMAEQIGQALTPDGPEKKHHHGKKKHRRHHEHHEPEHREPEMTQQAQPAMT